jgi:membrane fusion protein (multidrug efflux system)
LAKLGGDPARRFEEHPDFMMAETELSMAEMNLSYTEVRAPIDGIVTRLKLEAGEWVESGEPAFGLIAVDRVWIEANLKETQLTHVEVGQNVTVELDAYPDQVWIAKVGSISPATGAEFSVLPPQNASGNWVKVVQRLPVRIEIQQEESQPKLRAGMTATVSIDTLHKRDLWNSIKSGFFDLVADNTKKGNS